MDSSSSSHKKIRKSLRSRRVYVDVHAPFAESKKDKSEAIQRKSKKVKLDAGAFVVTPMKSFDGTTRRDPGIDYIVKSAKTGKGIPVKSNVSSKPANQEAGGSEYCSETSMKKTVVPQCEPELNDMSDNHIDGIEVLEYQSENSFSLSDHQNVDDNQEFQRDAILQDNIKENEFEDLDLEDNCLEDVLKEINKDIGSLYSKYNKIGADLKEIKQILLTRPSQHCIRTVSSRFKQKTSYALLPKLPLLKKSAVRKMNTNAEDEDSDEYTDQLVSLFLKCLVQHNNATEDST